MLGSADLRELLHEVKEFARRDGPVLDAQHLDPRVGPNLHTLKMATCYTNLNSRYISKTLF